MRPIAAPYTALRCRDSVGARDGTAICIRWWSTLGVSVGTRQLHPRATLVDKCTDFAEERMVHSIRLWDVGEMIKYNRRGNPLFEDRHDLQDFGGRRIDLDMPAEVVDSPGKRLQHLGRCGAGLG